ncbi:WecB/TagA/CpsF family glycosyltransferase [Alkalihalobacillus oceani]|uniref:N-acetylglucosaminyldiphosphoundecaprenol N-acetyl-beta-D-mannosaminyltransferase n=1 Tax=Halalkalibacter oceani TaxID=1653776 RepID=A0A9X2DVL7_9BACI|nr:WecB/TagA/CpsF family glycosyltransferase [Halalkalibacter oceani]MCM3716143.1 WecB/TagA/CpsF family glycosyltransferase [Halalkalibacter oceani]
MSNRTVSVLGVDFLHTTMNEMIARLSGHLEREEKAFVVTANPEIVLHAQEDEAYRTYLAKASYITADGIGVVKAAGLLGDPLPERVTGFDMFLSLLEVANERKFSVYLLGAKEEVLEKTIAAIERQFPQVEVAGSHHGYFDWDSTEIEDEIRLKKPDLVFLALGFPRQEKWIAERYDQFEKGIFMGIGGSFDVLAGEVKRAPVFWQKIHLEWFYRLVKQPSRWRRMLALPVFAGRILREKRKRTS